MVRPSNTFKSILRQLKMSFSLMFFKFPKNSLDSLSSFENCYLDIPEYQKKLSSAMINKLESDKELFDYRGYIKDNKYGMGEDEYVILWQLIVNSMNEEFSFCEIGVHKGQIIALIDLLSKRANKKVLRCGISPMNGANTRYRSNFKKDVYDLHQKFNLSEDYVIIEGLSTDQNIICQAQQKPSFDILYIDGSHETEDVKSDFYNYLPLIKVGGILVVDDCNNNMPFTYGFPFELGGRFWGIQNVSDVTDQFMLNNKNFKYIGSIIHNRLWKKIA